MMSRKKIILIVSIMITVTIAGIIVVINSSNQEPEVSNDNVVLFHVDGLDNPKYLFSSDTQGAIILGIDQYLRADNIKTDGLSGVIREGSYTQTEEGDTTVSSLLIDIPDIKRTYKVFSSGSGDPYGDNRLMIMCPSENELKYGTFDCRDDTI